MHRAIFTNNFEYILVNEQSVSCVFSFIHSIRLHLKRTVRICLILASFENYRDIRLGRSSAVVGIIRERAKIGRHISNRSSAA